MYNNPRQLQDICSLYESIYSESLSENENESLLIKFHNCLVREGFIDSNLIEDGVLTEGAVDKIASTIVNTGRVLRQLTGVGTKPTSMTQRVLRGLQKGGTAIGTWEASKAADIPNRLWSSLRGAAQGFIDPNKSKYEYNSFNPFDVIKGHLMSEGYAESEEAALKIMAHMSEEWKYAILNS